MRFTDTWIKTLSGKKHAYRKFEKGLIRGFGLRVTPKGVVSFFLCFQTSEGKTRYKVLGSYPVMSLSSAREAALLLREKIDTGEYETQEVVKQQVQGTLKDLCDYYVQEMEAAGKVSFRKVNDTISQNVYPIIPENTLANEVTSEQIRDIIHACIERGVGPLANRLRSYLNTAFNAAIAHDLDPRKTSAQTRFNIKINPVTAVPIIREFERVSERVLTLEELAEVWNYEGSVISRPHLIVFKLMVIYGLRPSEVTQAKVSEFDFGSGIWSLPPERVKNRRWHVLPLTEITESLVREAMSYSMSGTCLFRNKNDINRPEGKDSFGHAIKRLTKELGMEPWSPKDLRGTVKTWAGMAGLSKEIRDRIQNHALTDVSAKHYDRHLYLPEKLEGILLWEDYLKNEGIIIIKTDIAT